MNYYDSELQRLQSEIMEKQRTDAKLSDLLLQQSDLEKKNRRTGKDHAEGTGRCRPSQRQKPCSILLQSDRENR